MIRGSKKNDNEGKKKYYEIIGKCIKCNIYKNNVRDIKTMVVIDRLSIT